MANATVFECFQQADLLSQQAETLCESYDSDRAIDIETAKNPAYNELETRWHQLQRAMQPIPDTLSAGVDHPFDMAMDEFMEKLSNMNIMGYTTMARGAYSNGMNAAGVSKYKMKVGLGDILGSSSPLTDYLQVEYEEMRQKVGDVSFEEYQKMAFADTSFDYYSKSEQITGLAVTIIVNGTALAVGAMLPVPIMIALGLAGGVKNGYDTLSGKDLITGKELSQGDRILRGLAGIADIGLAAYGTYKGIKAMKGTKGVVPKVEVDGFHGKSVKVEKTSGAKAPKVEIKNPLSKKNQSHINKHNMDSLKNQSQYLTESQLAEKLEGNSFFNPNWTVEDINKYTEIAYNDLLSKGKKGDTFLYKINGEEISIYINPDGGFGTAYGKYQYTLEQFKNFMK
ncbi:pre-toxin TG domain-containing protein [Enterococcus rivorum]|nr:pre-toxin TG domain-containing protein [Enterococcus rivorum]MBP2100453.1 hypothetical protein [Enterococcus rivorum]